VKKADKVAKDSARMPRSGCVIVIDPKNPRGIVWLASYPKSGNTWIRAFLFAMFGVLAGAPTDNIDLNRMVQFGENERDVAFFARHLKTPATSATRAEIAEARLKVQADIVAAHRGVVLAKTHNALIVDAGFPTINRGLSAGAVYVVRNPLDVAISYAHFFGLSLDDAIARLGESGYATQTNDEDVYFVTGSWREHVESWTRTGSPQVLVVRYEDLLDRPVETFGAIAGHVMMPQDPALLRHAIELVSFRRLQSDEIAHGFSERHPKAKLFFREGRAGQWREVLSERQIQRIVDAHGPVMQRFGYLPA
jgi:hypothetical protein